MIVYIKLQHLFETEEFQILNSANKCDEKFRDVFYVLGFLFHVLLGHYIDLYIVWLQIELFHFDLISF